MNNFMNLLASNKGHDTDILIRMLPCLSVDNISTPNIFILLQRKAIGMSVTGFAPKLLHNCKLYRHGYEYKGEVDWRSELDRQACRYVMYNQCFKKSVI